MILSQLEFLGTCEDHACSLIQSNFVHFNSLLVVMPHVGRRNLTGWGCVDGVRFVKNGLVTDVKKIRNFVTCAVH
jgi:hypothetical protein